MSANELAWATFHQLQTELDSAKTVEEVVVEVHEPRLLQSHRSARPPGSPNKGRRRGQSRACKELSLYKWLRETKERDASERGV